MEKSVSEDQSIVLNLTDRPPMEQPMETTLKPRKTNGVTSLKDQCIKIICIYLDSYKYDFPSIIEIYETCNNTIDFQVSSSCLSS